METEDAEHKDERARRAAAMAKLEAHWATLEPIVVGPWTREELYQTDVTAPPKPQP
jgi:hypothetical protein